ncbi:MAG: hypothetical protein HQL05_10670 [Nitrospirae bacterium]|uniref:hypothetical protein n=1 Tax=Candidatus Magnetobacterium casense TaxID=1455061 RepID=UPI00058C9E23|nr:hypothetical protein [Candidatus Magnetobacterium casensis]MBF0338282.1 hypothetical protein [Nitrospirota bacterium]
MKKLATLMMLAMQVFVLSCNHTKTPEAGARQDSYGQLWQMTGVQKPPQAIPLHVAKSVEFKDASLATGADEAPKLAHG